MKHQTLVVIWVVAASLALLLNGPPANSQELPTVDINPPSGPVGSFIEFTGSGFTDPWWDADVPRVWLIRAISDECELVLGLENTQIEVNDEGILSGSGNVGAIGGCKQSNVLVEPVPTGPYGMSIGCYTCTVGEFNVTHSTPPSPPKGLPHTGPREDQLTGFAGTGVALLVTGATLLLLTRKSSDRT